MKIAIRVDSSENIGTGHVYRCLTLARELATKGHTCLFFCKPLYGNIIDYIKSSGFEVIVFDYKSHAVNASLLRHADWLEGNEQDDASAFIKINNTIDLLDVIIIDHYALSAIWQRAVRQYSKARLVVIDDLCDREHAADILIDQTFAREAEEYQRLLPANATILAGSKYALIRPEFLHYRESSLKRKNRIKKPVNLLITMGGVDKYNYSARIINILKEIRLLEKFNITLVAGSKSPHKQALMSLCADNNINYRVNVSNMAQLMCEADMAIGALGSTTWERAVLALPTINLVIADNQQSVAEKLRSTGQIIMDACSVTPGQLLAGVNAIVNDYPHALATSLGICDGLGTRRLAQRIVPELSKKGREVWLKVADTHDVDFIYQLQCLPETRRYARTKSIPDYQAHCSWMKNKINDVACNFYIVMVGKDLPVGSIRIDKKEEPELGSVNEISIFIHPDCFGESIARIAVERLIYIHPDTMFLATVLPENKASKILFSRLGFIKFKENAYVYKGNYGKLH